MSVQGKATSSKSSEITARTPTPKRVSHSSVVVAAVIFLIFVFLLIMYLGSTTPNTKIHTTTTPHNTAVPSVMTETLYFKGIVAHQFGRTSPNCQLPGCGGIYYENFTVLPNATNTHLTGSFSASDNIGLAVFTRFQYVRYMNSTLNASAGTYYASGKNDILNIPLDPGNYVLVFISMSNATSTLTITEPILLNYTLSPNPTSGAGNGTTSSGGMLSAVPSGLPAWVSGKYGSASIAFMISGGTPPYHCSLADDSALPSGLTLNSNCVISGIHILSSGTTGEVSPPFTVSITDSAFPAASASLTLSINTTEGNLVLLPITSGKCTVGANCNVKVATAEGGTPPYSYTQGTYMEGTLPIGMTLNTNGNLTGSPESAGAYNFTVCVTDMVSMEDCGQTSVNIMPPARTTWEIDISGTWNYPSCMSTVQPVYGFTETMTATFNGSILNLPNDTEYIEGYGNLSGSSQVVQQVIDTNPSVSTCALVPFSYSDVPITVDSYMHMQNGTSKELSVDAGPSSTPMFMEEGGGIDLYGNWQTEKPDIDSSFGWGLIAQSISPTRISGIIDTYNVTGSGEVSGTFTMTLK
jgi:hypothetical protein